MTTLWPFTIVRANDKTHSGFPIVGTVCDIKAEDAGHAIMQFYNLGVFSPPSASLRYKAVSVLQPPED